MRASYVLALILAASASPAFAGPPYVTDDPEPTDLGKWEVYAYGEGTVFRHHSYEVETGFDINYGAAKDLQVTTVLPIGIEREDGHTRSGLGDVELGAKYMFVHQRDGTVVPDISFYPTMTLPTAHHGLGSGKVGAFFPLWAQKDIGAWSMFGGGGYAVNPGRDAKDSWLVGYALTRQLTDTFNLGAEIYHETADEIGGKSGTGIGLGMIYDVNEHWSILASGGPMLEHREEAGRYAFYMSLAFHD